MEEKKETLKFTENQEVLLQYLYNDGAMPSDEFNQRTINSLVRRKLIIERLYANGYFIELTDKGLTVIDRWGR